MRLARRGREERRRRCRDIGDDERQRDRPQSPSARRVGAGRAHLFVAPPRRCPCIDSSSRLDLGSVALPTNITVFMEVSTEKRVLNCRSRKFHFLAFFPPPTMIRPCPRFLLCILVQKLLQRDVSEGLDPIQPLPIPWFATKNRPKSITSRSVV